MRGWEVAFDSSWVVLTRFVLRIRRNASTTPPLPSNFMEMLFSSVLAGAKRETGRSRFRLEASSLPLHLPSCPPPIPPTNPLSPTQPNPYSAQLTHTYLTLLIPSLDLLRLLHLPIRDGFRLGLVVLLDEGRSGSGGGSVRGLTVLEGGEIRSGLWSERVDF